MNFQEIKRACTVPLKIHWTFVIIPIILITYAGFLSGLVMSLVLAGSILFHEYSHVLVSQKNNVYVSHVVLMGLGAGAMIDVYDIIDRPWKSIKIAIAGPVSSILLSIFCFIFSIISFYITGTSFLTKILIYMGIVNIAIAIFNLLPIYPMDGGRVLNGFLSIKYGSYKAIKISSVITYILATLSIVFFAIFNMWFAMVVMIFLILMARWEKDKLIDILDNK